MSYDSQNRPFVPPPPPSIGNPLFPPDVLNQKAKEIADDAKKSLIFGVLGVFCLGFVFGIFAVIRANKARENIKLYEVGQEHKSMAIAGLVLGIVDIVGWALGLIARVTLR